MTEVCSPSLFTLSTLEEEEYKEKVCRPIYGANCKPPKQGEFQSFGCDRWRLGARRWAQTRAKQSKEGVGGARPEQGTAGLWIGGQRVLFGFERACD